MVQSGTETHVDTFRRGVELFNTGRFFECHEVWEELWHQERGPDRLFLQALIHIAVAFHHQGLGNRRGAGRQLDKGLRKLAGYLPRYRNMDTERLYRESLAAREALRLGGPVAWPRLRCTSGS